MTHIPSIPAKLGEPPSATVNALGRIAREREVLLQHSQRTDDLLREVVKCKGKRVPQELVARAQAILGERT